MEPVYYSYHQDTYCTGPMSCERPSVSQPLGSTCFRETISYLVELGCQSFRILAGFRIGYQHRCLWRPEFRLYKGYGKQGAKRRILDAVCAWMNCKSRPGRVLNTSPWSSFRFQLHVLRWHRDKLMLPSGHRGPSCEFENLKPDDVC